MYKFEGSQMNTWFVVLSILTVFGLCHPTLAQADVKIDESLKSNYSYSDLSSSSASTKQEDDNTFLMVDDSGVKRSRSSQAQEPTKKPQCFAVNRNFVNCLPAGDSN
jgi:hypothetical protein